MRYRTLGIVMGIGIGCLLPHFGNGVVLLGVAVLLASCGFVLGRMAGNRWLAAIGCLYGGQALAWLCQPEQMRRQLDPDPELALFQMAGVLAVMTLVAIPAAIAGCTLRRRNQEGNGDANIRVHGSLAPRRGSAP